MARERGLRIPKNLNEAEKKAFIEVYKEKESMKLENPAFDRMGHLIVYRYCPRCLYCNDVNRGHITGGNGVNKVWKCRKCGRITEIVYCDIEAPEY